MEKSKRRPEEEVHAHLTHLGLTIAVAESLTGGLLGHRLTNISGSSAYMLGGIIAYSNESKEKLLGVARETLTRYGAVSEPTVLEMARGARAAFGADLALATTGIAGPTGGTSQKPVGLVYIAVAGPHGERSARYLFSGDRLQNKEASTEAALRLLLKYLEEHYTS